MKMTIESPETCGTAVVCGDLLGELWQRLKILDAHCTESMSVALTPRAFDSIEGQRMMVREIQNWLLAHGYSPNDQAERQL